MMTEPNYHNITFVKTKRITQGEQCYLSPMWPVPLHIKAFASTRIGGVSHGVYQGFNLASHVGDEQKCVEQNRMRLETDLNIKSPIAWLTQTHSTKVVNAVDNDFKADAIFTNKNDTVCAVMTADCLAILMCDESGDYICAIHAGWKGLLAGVIDNAIQSYHGSASSLSVWFGPSILKSHYEVTSDLKEQFQKAFNNIKTETFFTATTADHYLCDLVALAAFKLNQLGVHRLYHSALSTFGGINDFYSYRKEGHTGRLACLIYKDGDYSD